MKKPIPLPNNGTLDKDTDPENIKPGDYTDLRGMDFTEAEMPALRTQRGNKFVVDFGAVTTKNQRTRINFNETPTTITITLRDANRNIIATSTVGTLGTVISNKAAVAAFINGLPFTSSIAPIAPSVPRLEFVLGFAFSDYEITVTGCTTQVLEEAISQTGVGNYIPIGSFDLNDDLFVWLTTQRNLPRQLNPVLDAYSSTGGQIGLLVEDHGLVNNETVAIGSVGGTVEANGIWTVTVIDQDNFILNNSTFVNAWSGSGVAFADIFGYGCFGVVTEDVLTDTFTFTPLLRSKKLNFNTKKRIYNPVMQVTGNFIQAYYTDGYNVPRVTYYRGEYQADGCINAINPLGEYSYTNLENETSLQVNYNGYTLTFDRQLQSGGNIAAGNWRYGVRFLSSSQAATELSFLTNPVPVFLPQYTDVPSVIYGSPSNVLTGKINRVTVSNISPGLFQFVELIAFQYAGEANTVTTSSYIIRRETLTADQTDITLEHNGNEPGILFFDATLANLAQQKILTAVDMVAIENRLVLENITVQSQIDISDWVSTFKYSIKRKPLLGSYAAETTDEFYNPENVVTSVGYPFYEWDRFYVAPVLKNGTVLNCFFAFDLRWVSQSDYAGNPEFQFLETNGSDRRELTGDDFIDYNLGSDFETYYQYYLVLKNVDWSFLIDGKQARELFLGLKVFRAQNVREILGSGCAVVGWNPFGVPNSVKEFTNYLNVDYSTVAAPFRKKNFVSFYSPDVLFANSEIEFQPGDKMLFFSAFQASFFDSFIGTLTVDSAYRVNSPVLGSTSAEILDVEEVVFINKGEVRTIAANNYSKNDAISILAGGENQSSPVIKLNTGPLVPVLGNVDTGYYHAVYWRQRADKYGNPNSPNVTEFTNATLLADETEVDVFGGYAFTQQTWLKNAYAVTGGTPSGQGAGFNIISQNRTNSNLRLWDSALTTNLLFPVSTQDYAIWIENGQNLLDQIDANPAYEIKNNVQAIAVYNPFNQDTGQYISRKTYSELKPNNSLVDFWRVFLPLSFQDNPETQGRITRGLNLNNRLFTIQERGFTIEYFNNQGQLVSQDVGQILIGDGSVLSRIGTNITMYGAKQSGAVVVGKSQSGKDTAMWFSSTFGEFLRFGDDGIRSVSLRGKMRTFFNRYNKWVNNADTPADGYGISGVWDDANKNYYFTFKAWKPYSQWQVGTTYSVGSGVLFGEIGQGVPQIWIANQSTNTQPSDTNTAWTKIEIDNADYYNVFTIAFSEIKNGFTFFPYYLPNIYLPWKQTFFAPNPLLDTIQRSRLYLHNAGSPNQFFDVDYNGGEIELVMNWQPNLNKKLMAMLVNANIKPERVEFRALFRNEPDGETEKESFLVTSDFETRESYQYSTIKNTIDENGSVEGDTGKVEGVYCLIRIIFPAEQVAKLNDCIVLIRDSFRNFTK